MYRQVPTSQLSYAQGENHQSQIPQLHQGEYFACREAHQATIARKLLSSFCHEIKRKINTSTT